MDVALTDLPAGLYRGRVEGLESGSCEARVEVRRVPGGCVSLDYEAVGAQGVQHVEHSVVSSDAIFVAHSESSGVQVFTRVAPGVFETPPAAGYRMRLVVDWDGSRLSWAWHWAPAGQELQEQSRADVRLVKA